MLKIYKLECDANSMKDQYFELERMAKDAGTEHALDHYGRKFIGKWNTYAGRRESLREVSSPAPYHVLNVTSSDGDELAKYFVTEVTIVPASEKGAEGDGKSTGEEWHGIAV